MASLLEDLAEPPRQEAKPCTTAVWIAAQGEAAEARLKEILDSREWQTVKVHAVMVKWGYPLQYNMLLKHRNGGCSCGPAR